MRDFVELQLALAASLHALGRALGSAGSPHHFFVAVIDFLLGLSFVVDGVICSSPAVQTSRAAVVAEVQ